jgi:hypothetical protein
MALLASAAQAEPLKMVVNEWNCVSASKSLTTGDSYFGLIKGNGDNWVELAVVSDHLDIRGWAIQWNNADTSSNSGTLTFSNDAVWSDLRQGTIIGLHENDTANDGSGGAGALPSDTSFSPLTGDWTILASINDPSLIIKDGWKVDHNDWEGKILDAYGNTIQGYVGEPTSASVVYATAGGLGSDEVGALINGPRIVSTSLSYKDKSSVSSFLSPNVGQDADFTAMRNEVLVPEPAAAALLLSGLIAAYGPLRFCRRRLTV